MMRNARTGDAERLTQISFAAKGYWRYPTAWFAVWRNELTVDAAYIRNNDPYKLLL